MEYSVASKNYHKQKSKSVRPIVIGRGYLQLHYVPTPELGWKRIHLNQERACDLANVCLQSIWLSPLPRQLTTFHDISRMISPGRPLPIPCINITASSCEISVLRPLRPTSSATNKLAHRASHMNTRDVDNHLMIYTPH